MKIHFLILISQVLVTLPLFANSPNPLYLGLELQDQKYFDLLPGSRYLHPQAFADNPDSITSVKLKVCVEWSEASQAAFESLPDNGRYSKDDSSVNVPYEFPKYPRIRRYIQFANPDICRRFQTVIIPTSETVLKSIQAVAASGDQGTYNSLARVDGDLDRRIQALMSDQAILTMRREMELKIKEEILEGPFVKELTQKIYDEIKAQFEYEKIKTQEVK